MLALMSPVLPSEFKESVVLPEDDLGTAIVKAHVQFQHLYNVWYQSVFDANGEFTDEFREAICAIGCS